MRILHVLESAGLYGKERVVLELMEAQRRAGLRPLIGGITRIARPAEQPVLAAAAARGLETLPLAVRGLRDPARLRRAVLAAGVELVHAHDYKSSIVLAPFRRLRALPPLIRTLHGYTTVGRFSRMQAYELLDRWCLRWHDAVVAVSGAMRVPTGRELVVIENGIAVPDAAPGTGAADPDLAAARTLGRNALVLGSLARLAPEKNLEALIGAVAALKEAGVPGHLIVLGEGRGRAALEAEAARLGVGDRVWLPGFKADVRPWLALFDLYLQPSWTEGLPIALLEAMHAGVPLLLTPVGGMTEILAAGAAVPIPFGGRDIARVVRRLHATPDGRAEAQAAAVQAAALARERYSSESMARAYRTLYEQVLARAGAPRLTRARAGGS